MKKIFITGVLLILLIIITADLYNDHKRANDQRNELQATNTTTGNSAALPAATAINTDASANNNTNNITGTQLAVTTVASRKYHRHGRHTSDAVNAIDGDMLLTANAPDEGGMVAVLDENEEPAIAAESSKSFYGNLPEKKTASEQHRGNVHFAPEISFMQNDYYNNSSSDLMSYGLRAGGILDIGLGDHFALQPGIMYELKGVEMRNVYSNSLMEEDTKDKIDLHYIQVPLDFVVKFGDWHDGRIIAGAGPYLAYLVNAQDKYQATTYTFNNSDANPVGRTTLAANSGSVADNRGITVEGQRTLRVSGDANTPDGSNLRALDWGINGFVGCEMPGGFYAKAGTEVGLRNIQGNTDGTYAGRNLNFFLSVGYLIGYKR